MTEPKRQADTRPRLKEAASPANEYSGNYIGGRARSAAAAAERTDEVAAGGLPRNSRMNLKIG